MSKAWSYLQCRYGESTASPTINQIKNAVSELYHENIPGMTLADYEEHGDISVRYGFDEGPMYVLQISRSGKVTWEEWADQDYEMELQQPKSIYQITEDKAVELLAHLTQGDLELIRREFTNA